MYSILLEIHSIFRYILLVLLLALIIKNLVSWIRGSGFSGTDNLLSLITVSTAHLQLITGLVLYIISPMVRFRGDVMGNDTLRYWTLEHILLMMIAIGLFTAGRIIVKKKAGPLQKHRSGFAYNFSGLLLILLALFMSSRGII